MREAFELLLQDGVFDADAAYTVRKARAAIGEVAGPDAPKAALTPPQGRKETPG